MQRKRVLFVCIHNSARSQMAEELLRKLAGDVFDVESAGIEPGTLNPYVVKVLLEEDIDISGKKTKSAFDLVKQGGKYDYVITVCDETSAEQCPIFPGKHKRLHWGFPDPSKFKGTDEEIILKIKEIKSQIKDKIEIFINEID
jgi:arsenate reductase (thioredoxin)